MSDQPARPRRNFHQTRPSANTLQSNLTHQSHGSQMFHPLPKPTGEAPYHLSLADVLPQEQIDAIQHSGRILFHVAGDTGGVKAPQSQEIVAMHMEEQFNFADITFRPSFFYHLGDVVYYFGEGKEYYPQFYEPYVHYPAPIFAIPGNHDGDMADDSDPSLTAFVNNFCAESPVVTPEAAETDRDAMTQPNVYWTLEAPFVTIIGLYSNVPEGGRFDNQQLEWFVNELATAPADKALLVAVHHPAYSADTNHSGSRYIADTLDNAFERSGRMADLVMSGHVHNYQRFTRPVNGRHIPYIVAGAGGYWHLHYIAKMPDKSDIVLPYTMPDHNVTLENHCDNRHSFMRLLVTNQHISGECFTVPRPQENWRDPAQRIDGFELDWHTHRLIRGTQVP